MNLATVKSICIAIPTYDGRIPVETAVQLSQAVGSLQRAGIAVDIQWGAGSALIDLCRNRLVKKFLTQTTAEKLFFLDSDIIFQAQDLLYLVMHSEKCNEQGSAMYPVVGAVYPVRKDPPKFFIKALSSGIAMNEDGLIEIGGCGMGFMMIDRSVFEQMDDKVEEFISNDNEVLKAYFDIRIINKHYKGEDISFFIRYTEECGGHVFIDPQICLKHVGTKEYDYQLLDYLDNKLERVA